MGYGEVWWFVRGERASLLDEMIGALHDAGLAAGNPATGEPQIIDEDGQQVHWDPDEVRLRWRAGRGVTVQLWLNPTTDVLVELIGSQQLLTFDLDGMTTAEARAVVFAILNAALSITATVAVISDRNLPDRGDKMVIPASGGSSDDQLPSGVDMKILPAGPGSFSLYMRPDSWLMKRTSDN